MIIIITMINIINTIIIIIINDSNNNENIRYRSIAGTKRFEKVHLL